MLIKMFRLCLVFTLVLPIAFCYAQSINIINGIDLPKDTVVKNELIHSLNGFLDQKEKPNNLNEYVLKEDLLETSALLDELKGMEGNARAKDFFKPYLTNVIQLDEKSFMVQLSYLGLMDNMPVLRASFRLLTKQKDGRFYFNSPLKQNAVTWKIKKIGTINYHFKTTLENTGANAYYQAINLYDKKLKAPYMPVEFYFCDNFPEVLQMLGVEYKADYNGKKNESLTARENKENLTVNGGSYYTTLFDPHDLWHERLRNVMNSDLINRPVDEGCAYLYGGSWGFTWKYVLKKFKEYAADNPNADWLALYIQGTNFVNGDRIMKISYVLNALIVQKTEKENGFSPVMELLGCGKQEKGDENYFKALGKLTGINKGNFNTKMSELILASN